MKKNLLLYIILFAIAISISGQNYKRQNTVLRDSINNLQEQGQQKKADELMQEIINSNDSLLHPLRTDLVKEKIQQSKEWQKESIKYLKNKKIDDKLSIFQAVESIQPDSLFFVNLNKNFSKLSPNTKTTFVHWMTVYNKNNQNINTLFVQDKIIEMLYTSKGIDEKLAVGKCLQTYPNELSLLAITNLLKSENTIEIDIAKTILFDFEAKNLNKELRKILFNNKNEYQKMAILDIYKDKKSSEYLPEVIALLSADDDETIQHEGYQTIAIIADKEQLETLEVLLENAPESYKYILQNKIEELKEKP